MQDKNRWYQRNEVSMSSGIGSLKYFYLKVKFLVYLCSEKKNEYTRVKWILWKMALFSIAIAALLLIANLVCDFFSCDTTLDENWSTLFEKKFSCARNKVLSFSIVKNKSMNKTNCMVAVLSYKNNSTCNISSLSILQWKLKCNLSAHFGQCWQFVIPILKFYLSLIMWCLHENWNDDYNQKQVICETITRKLIVRLIQHNFRLRQYKFIFAQTLLNWHMNLWIWILIRKWNFLHFFPSILNLCGSAQSKKIDTFGKSSIIVWINCYAHTITDIASSSGGECFH